MPMKPVKRGFKVLVRVDSVTTASLERGKTVFCQREDLVASDKRPVTMLSTLAQADATHIAQKKERNGTRSSVQFSDAVQPVYGRCG